MPTRRVCTPCSASAPSSTRPRAVDRLGVDRPACPTPTAACAAAAATASPRRPDRGRSRAGWSRPGSAGGTSVGSADFWRRRFGFAGMAGPSASWSNSCTAWLAVLVAVVGRGRTVRRRGTGRPARRRSRRRRAARRATRSRPTSDERTTREQRHAEHADQEQDRAGAERADQALERPPGQRAEVAAGVRVGVEPVERRSAAVSITRWRIPPIATARSTAPRRAPQAPAARRAWGSVSGGGVGRDPRPADQLHPGGHQRERRDVAEQADERPDERREALAHRPGRLGVHAEAGHDAETDEDDPAHVVPVTVEQHREPAGPLAPVACRTTARGPAATARGACGGGLLRRPGLGRGARSGAHSERKANPHP